MKNIFLLTTIFVVLFSCGNNSKETKAPKKAKARLITVAEKRSMDSIARVRKDSLHRADSLEQEELFKREKPIYSKNEKLRKKYIGFKYLYPKSLQFVEDFGNPETLEGTDNNEWIAYFPLGDFTIIMNKSNNVFENIVVGRNPSLKFDR